MEPLRSDEGVVEGAPAETRRLLMALDRAPDILHVASIPFPDDPGAFFSGTLTLQPPASAEPGELIVSAATISALEDSAAGIALENLTRRAGWRSSHERGTR